MPLILDWSYSGDPTTSPMDEVRFLVGDTDSSDKLVSDTEINYTISLVYGTQPPAQGNYLPAAHVADAIAARLARQADKAVGDLHISFSQRTKNYQQLSARLKQRATLAAVPAFSGGSSRSDKAAVDADPNRVGPAVTIDGMNYASPGPPQVAPGEPNIP